MIKNTTILALILTISACSNIKFNSNVDDYFIASHVARDGLYEFYSGQQAIESGATLLGMIEGKACLAYKHEGYEQYKISQLKAQAIESLKQDALHRGANAYLFEQCRDHSVNSNECAIGIQCVGQAYDY